MLPIPITKEIDMTVNIQGATQVTQTTTSEQQNQEAIHRRQRNAISADLREIQADLRLDLLQGQALDSVTNLILEWHKLFTKVLEVCENPQQEYDTYKGLLQQILVDAIFRSALDENCLLGNDGEVYSEMALQVYRNMAPVEFQNRSPLHPTIDTPFETKPHTIARYMVGWLVSRHNTPLRNAQNEILEEAYRQLKFAAERLPPQHVDQDETIRMVMAQQVQRQAQREQKRNAQIEASRVKFEEQRKAEVLPLIQQKFAEVKQKIDHVAQHHLKKQAQLNQEIRKEIDELQSILAKVEAEIVELEKREKAVGEKKQRIQGGIVELRSTHQQLEMEKIQLQKEIKESEKGGLQSLGSALLTIGLCALSSWAIKAAMSAYGGASGAAVTVKPRPNGFLIEGLLKIKF
jgi:hypothetical protein